MGHYTFGPVASRRFGRSLGVDLSPQTKQCNYDCLYCELGGAKSLDRFHEVAPVEAIVDDVAQVLKRHSVDVITLTANGEPTLYPHLQTLIDRLKTIKGEAQLMILSNGSTIADLTVQAALMALDRVKLSLDSATEETFRKLDRPHHLNLDAMIRAMADFRVRYRGELMIEILVVAGLNDTEAEFDALGRVLTDINPDRIDVGTIARPPAYGVQPVDADRLTQLTARLNHPAVHIIAPKNTRPAESYSRKEILATLQKRPLSLAETGALFDSQSQQMLQALLENGMVEVTQTGSEKFYKIARNT